MYFNQKSNLAAEYLRISREDGDKLESDSIRSQRGLIAEYLKQHENIRLVQEYVDDGYSGTNYDRPAFKRMLEDAKKKKINCIIVKDLSRLGRNYIETGKYLEKVFPFLGVRFIAITDHYDSADRSDDADQIIVPFKNLINDAYCRDISTKIRSQLDVKRRNGQFIGSFAGYGYRKDPEDRNHLVVDEYAAGIVQAIFRWKIEGCSSLRIAQKLDEMGVLPPLDYKRSCGYNYNCGFRSGADPKWTAVAVNRILKNEMYTGTVVQGKNRKINYKVKQSRPVAEEDWIRVTQQHEAIISEDIFQYVQELLGQDTRTSPEEDAVYLFSGFLSCGDCGQNMVKRSTTRNGKKYYYYHCSTYKNKEGCSSHIISVGVLESVVLEGIRNQIDLLVHAEAVIQASGDKKLQGVGILSVEKQLETLHCEEERYQALKAKLYQDFQDQFVSLEEYQEYNRRFSENIRKIRVATDEAERKKARLLADGNRESSWLETFRQYQNIDHLDRKAVVMLIDRIIVYSKERIEIRYRYQDEMNEMLLAAASMEQDGKEDVRCGA